MGKNLTYLIIENEEHLNLLNSKNFSTYFEYYWNYSDDTNLTNDEINNFKKYDFDFDDRYFNYGHKVSYYEDFFTKNQLIDLCKEKLEEGEYEELGYLSLILSEVNYGVFINNH